jgi:DNA-directed RNA polymerase specialized sigma24 family protein
MRLDATAPDMADAFLTREARVREADAAHAGELYGFALRSLEDRGLAEEAVQDTFVRPNKEART